MTGRYDPVYGTDYLLEGSPSGVRVSNMRQLDCNSDLGALTTAVLTSVAVPVQTGEVITSITFKSGATPAGTPLNWWFALYSPAGALLAQTADQATAAWAANTVKTLDLATAQRASAAGVYYVGIMVKATTPPTLIGHDVGLAGAADAILSSKVLAQTSGSGLTTTAPATIATPTTIKQVPFVVLT